LLKLDSKMKHTLLIIFFLFFGRLSSAQEISCQKLYETITSQYDSESSVSCIGSSLLAKATYYTLDDMGFVIAYIKENEYDINGKPYIFCGISSQRWSYFKSDGIYSWGKSFHKYIRDYTCNCY